MDEFEMEVKIAKLEEENEALKKEVERLEKRMNYWRRMYETERDIHAWDNEGAEDWRDTGEMGG